MPCQREKNRFDAAMAKLRLLWDQLETAPPPKKPAIVKKIEAQSAIVDQRKDELDECLRQHAPPSRKRAATLNLSFDSNKASAMLHQAGIAATFKFGAPSSPRTFQVDDLVVKRSVPGYTTTYTIAGISGTLETSDGTMTLAATIDVRLTDAVGTTLARRTVPLQLDTGAHTSKTGMWTPQGSALAGTAFTLAGTGYDRGEDLEYQTILEGVFASPP